MSIFSKKMNQRSEPEDLDSGYENPYYTVREDRDRREDRRDRGEDDYYETRRDSERSAREDYYEEDERRAPRYTGGYEEEEPRGYRERAYEEEELRRKPAKAPEKPAAPENKGTLYFAPESYRDVRVEIVTGVAESHVVMIDITNLVDTDEMVRLLDYIMGAVQVLGASLRRFNGDYLLLVPAGVEVNDEDIVIPEEPQEDYDEEYEDEEDFDEDYEDYDEE